MKRFLMILLAAMTLQGGIAQTVGTRTWRQGSAPTTIKENADYWGRQLGLTTKQRQRLEKLNRQYADLFRGPQSKGTPPPPQPSKRKRESWRVEGQTGASIPRHKTPVKKKPGKEPDKRWKAYEKSLKKILSDQQYQEYERLTRSFRQK